jgi:formylmethanofuran:tetrahydromethanopterin formyltransferase
MAEGEPGAVTIVTADRELKSRVRERKGRSTVTLPVSTIFESAEQTKAKRRTSAPAAYGGLPKGHADITKELERVWLDKEGM